MRGTVNDPLLGAGNVLFWLRDRGDDLAATRLWLDRTWIAPDGTSRATLSLANLIDAAGAYRRMYRDLGVAERDVVVVRVNTPIDAYLHWAALAANGAIAAPANANLSNDMLREYALRVGAVGYIVDGQHGGTRAAKLWWYSSPQDKQTSAVSPAGGVADGEYAHRPDDIVLLCHTSGTTGMPKAVSCSHHGFMVGIRNQMRQPPSALFGSMVLNALPAAHHSWFMTITWGLLSGTKVILSSDQSADSLVDNVARFEPDSIRSFSCTLREVAQLGLKPGALRSVGLWMTTGDVSRRRDIEAVVALGTHPVASPSGVTRAPGMFVLDGLGSTELGHLHFSILHAPGRTNDARCIGRPASFATAAVLDENGEELPDGQIGYLAVRSDAVTPGYWNEPERTARSRRGGFWITGDVGYRDEFGRYFHLDRHSDVIDTPEGRVYSVRCEEELLRSIPEVQRCALVGREADGIVKVVCLVESDDAKRDAAAWHRDVNAVLAKVSVLPASETVVLRPGTLPLGPTGKIRKFLVRAEQPLAARS
jgi:acyl-coenzyme A synthetase/AMP-(fatty) acid ligase